MENAKWISVKDRLPEPFEEVLVWVDYGDISFNSMKMTYRGLCGIWAAYDKFITHWMPLPKGPEV